MRWKLFFAALLAAFIFPPAAGAVDFSIPDVQIEAHLQPDGSVEVKEQHTYVFTSDFNGIIREAAPKEGASIEQFSASESGKALEVERRRDQYRVHRKGENETIVFDLHYKISNGMEKYEDGAQFYWPFFDRRNETDYGNMTITVIPPASAADVSLIGYDSAEHAGTVKSGGRAVFALGAVDAGTNGDIRVVYESELFPDMAAAAGEIRPVIKQQLEQREIEQEQFAAGQQKASVIGGIVLALGAAAAAFFSFIANARRRRLVNKARDEIASKGFYVPDLFMSMPALLTIRNGSLSIEAMAAALTDLIRKGVVRQTADDAFEVTDKKPESDHEQRLVRLLFYEVGKKGKMTLAELKKYTKSEKNYAAFQGALTNWQQLVKQEVQQYDVKEPQTASRTLLFLASFAGMILGLVFLLFELYILLAAALIFTLFTLGLAIFYSPYTYEMVLLLEEWKQVERWMNKIDAASWDSLSMDDRFKVLVYGIGTKHPELASYSKAFSGAQQQTASAGYYDSRGMVYNPVFISSSFSQASANVSSNAPSSSSSSSGGGGTGGGGGGSGAF